MAKKKRVNRESVTTIPQLAKVMRDSFQSHQDLILGEIGSTRREVGSLKTEMRSGFKQMTEKISNVSRNNVDVIHQEDFDKLKDRVVVLEEV